MRFKTLSTPPPQVLAMHARNCFWILTLMAASCVLPMSRGAQELRASSESLSNLAVSMDASLDPNVVYRFVPFIQGNQLGQQLAPIAAEEMQPKSVYYRYNATLQRHVWSILAEDGMWYFALGEGTTLRTELFRIEMTAEERLAVLETLAPRLKQKLEEPDKAKNINLYLRLAGQDQWRLMVDSLTPKVQSVFDIATGHRWEWHGDDRHAVLHTTGDIWQVVNGRYLPVSTFLPTSASYCDRRPAGSIRDVVRTSSLQ